MAGELNYPIHMYKNLCAPRYANDKKEVDKLEMEGWATVRANIGPQEYPRHLYNENGDTVLVGDYGKDGEVDLGAARAEEERYAGLGFGRKPVASNAITEAPVRGIMESIVDVKENANRLTALEGDVAEIKNGMAKILSALHGANKPSRQPKVEAEI